MQTPCLGLCQSKAARFVLRVMSPSHPRGKLAKQPRNGTVKKREKLFLCATNCLGQLLIPRAVIGNTTMAKATKCSAISKKKVTVISRNATQNLFSCLACKYYQAVSHHCSFHLICNLHFAVNTCGTKKTGQKIGWTGRATSVSVLTSSDWRTCQNICETTIDCVGWVLVNVNCTQKLKGNKKPKFSSAEISTTKSAMCTPLNLLYPGSTSSRSTCYAFYHHRLHLIS